jgi:hypothetical protein
MWQDENILMGQMHLSKSVQTLTILSCSSKTFQTWTICHINISQTTNMGSIVDIKFNGRAIVYNTPCLMHEKVVYL